ASRSTPTASEAARCVVTKRGCTGFWWPGAARSNASHWTRPRAGPERSSGSSTHRTCAAPSAAAPGGFAECTWAISATRPSAGRKMRRDAKQIRSTVPDPSTVLAHFEHHFRRLLHRALDHADRVLVVRQPWFEKDYTPDEAARFWHGGVGRPWKEQVSEYFSL